MKKFVLPKNIVNEIDNWKNYLKPEILLIMEQKNIKPYKSGEVYYGAIGGGITYIITEASDKINLTLREFYTQKEYKTEIQTTIKEEEESYYMILDKDQYEQVLNKFGSDKEITYHFTPTGLSVVTKAYKGDLMIDVSDYDTW